MSAVLVVGSQWGDEGKAKVIDYLSKDIDIIVRYQGGANAGHTVVVEGKKYVFHLVPSGVIYPNTVCVIGNGVVLDPEYFLAECKDLEKSGFNVLDKLYISDSCHILLPFHKLIDSAIETNSEPDKKIGTTKRGIGICYADKIMRIGLKVGNLYEKNFKSNLEYIVSQKNKEMDIVYGIKPVSFQEVFEQLKSFAGIIKKNVTNTSFYLNEKLNEGKRVLLEGAQGTGLDLDFGTYPYVTSSNPTTGGSLVGTGISYHYLDKVIGISKAYTTRVGEGPFPTEVFGEEGELLRKLGGEYGATTGRPRRCGWLDIELLKHSIRVNGIRAIALTKIDVLSHYETIKIGVGYKINGKELQFMPSYGLDQVEVVYKEFPGWKENIQGINDYKKLPKKCQDFMNSIRNLIGVPIQLISTGPDRKDTIINGL